MDWGAMKGESALTTYIPLGGFWLHADVHTQFRFSEPLLTDVSRVCGLCYGCLKVDWALSGMYTKCASPVDFCSYPLYPGPFVIIGIVHLLSSSSILSKEDKHMLDCITASEHFCAKQVFILAIAHHTCEFKLVRIINKNFFRADQQASVENSYA